MLTKKPVTGMKDMLPSEMEVRTYLQNLIRETYESFGFEQIETPCVEHIENLCSKQGGDNEKLIFKILKRGEKLRISDAKEEADLVDGGLRYDLTVPLARYYSNHRNEIAQPFKALQMGPVWRADRPQRGRFRQFMQCDIDILGEAGNLAEIELVTAMTTLLGKAGFTNFSIRINDRRLLKAMAAYAGFAEADYDKVFIILDKMDKIGLDGVRSELLEEGYPQENIDRYLALFDETAANQERDSKESIEALKKLDLLLGTSAVPEVTGSLSEIIGAVECLKSARFRVVFDPTLVRGMSYYTGTIFEVAMDEYGGSVGGGGRYDRMIGRFTGEDVPACGFSIGFERIVMLLLERGFAVPGKGEKTALLLDRNLSAEEKSEALIEAGKLRAEGRTVLAVTAKKNRKFQKEQLSAQGYEDIRDIYHRD